MAGLKTVDAMNDLRMSEAAKPLFVKVRIVRIATLAS